MLRIASVLLVSCFAVTHGTGGGLYMWGSNNICQLGDGTTSSHYTPIAITIAGKTIAALALGSDHTGAITTDGGLYMWGSNSNGKLGDDTTSYRSSPAAIIIVGKSFAKLDLGSGHSGAITTDGSLYMWGDSSLGQVGDGNTGYRQLPTALAIAGKSFATLALGGWHSGAIATDGSLYMWGYNHHGQVGDGAYTYTDHLSPFAIVLPGKSFATLALGGWHSGAITTDGGLYMWGANYFGQLGDGSMISFPTLTAVTIQGKIFTALALGGDHTGAITNDGALYMWGYNFFGQLGDGTISYRSVPTLIRVAGKSSATLALGFSSSGVITTDGNLYMWGYNGAGQLGDNTTTDHHIPTAIPPSGKCFIGLALGNSYSGAIAIPAISPSRSPLRSASPSKSPARSALPSRSPLRSASPSKSPARSASPSRSPSQSARPSPSPSLSPGEQCNVPQCTTTALYWISNCGGCIHLGNSVPSPCQSSGDAMAGASMEGAPLSRRNSQDDADIAVDVNVEGTSASSSFYSTGTNIYVTLAASIGLSVGFISGVALSILIHHMWASSAHCTQFAEAAP